jgi:septum formation inhibitor-activating ATPase MinD
MSAESVETRLVERVRDALAQFDHNEVDRPDGVESGLVRIRPTSRNKVMNNAELAAVREAGFVVEHVDMDNEEVWVRE